MQRRLQFFDWISGYWILRIKYITEVEIFIQFSSHDTTDCTVTSEINALIYKMSVYN